MRYLPHTAEEVNEMLRTIGVNDLEALFDIIPSDLRQKKSLNLPSPLSELELRNHLRSLSRRNAHGEEWSMFLGAGSYAHYIPSAVSYLLSRGEFLTAYTPYQAEISQGTLQAIYEYQTMMAEILGMEVANASQYDGSTGTAEAVRLALSVTHRHKVLVARSLHPEYRQVLHTYLKNTPVTIEEIPFTLTGGIDFEALKAKLSTDVACVVLPTPNFFGIVEDLTPFAKEIHEHGGLVVSVTPEPLSLGLFLSPGEMEVDIAVAEGQVFGNSMSFGGPGLGVFATKKDYIRRMPGRLVGETVDAAGQRGYVLTLSTREQHIRREKATSNICTNVSLNALAATITLALWGKSGFRELAESNYQRCEDVKSRITSHPRLELIFSGVTFNEFVVRLKTKATPDDVVRKLQDQKMIPGISLAHWYSDLEDCLLVCITEMNTDDQIEKWLQSLGEVL